VHNVYANARNHGYHAREFILTVMPAADRVEMHLAGGFLDERTGFYVDSHSEPISEEVWELYRFALQAAGPKVKAAFIERDTNFPDEQGWRNEVRMARQIAVEVFAESLTQETAQ
jgi:uncharacterized protein (UPF0276 family)